MSDGDLAILGRVLLRFLLSNEYWNIYDRPTKLVLDGRLRIEPEEEAVIEAIMRGVERTPVVSEPFNSGVDGE